MLSPKQGNHASGVGIVSGKPGRGGRAESGATGSGSSGRSRLRVVGCAHWCLRTHAPEGHHIKRLHLRFAQVGLRQHEEEFVNELSQSQRVGQP